MTPSLIRRAGRFLWWRWYAVGWRWYRFRQSKIIPPANRLAARWGWASRRLRWPLSAWAPYRRPELHLSRNAGLGDVLMCMPVIRELKRTNPECHVTFYTEFPSLVEGLPFIDAVRLSSETPWGIAIWLGYEESLPPRRHLARIIGDHLGLSVRDVRPSCVVDLAERDRLRAAWGKLPRPWVVINRRANAWTPNKNWPDAHWEDLIDRLLARCTVIEIGTGVEGRRPRTEPNYVDLVDRTKLPQLVAAIGVADIQIGPDSGPMHIAAAVGTPSVVIYGGYIDPVCTEYPQNINFYSPVPCAPCWLRTPCPYEKKCLWQITPEMVDAAVDRLWNIASAGLPQPKVGQDCR